MERFEPVIKTEELTVINSRIIDAPKTLVFKAWSDPEIIRLWWGPNGFTNTFKEFQFQPEGKWDFTMHGPNGANFPNLSTIKDISANERIVIKHENGPQFVATITFQDQAEDKTLLTFHMQFQNQHEFEQVIAIVPEANEQNFNRLEIQVAKMLVNKKPLLVREFNAPRTLVFEAFTKAEHLENWWGPTGFKLSVKELNLFPNGIFHYQMKSDQGFEMWGKFEYFEINAPDSIVFTNSFADEAGNIVNPPFPDPWPAKILNIWTFTEQDGKTVLTLRGAPFNADESETQTYINGIPSMEKGFSGTFDQLEDYLSKIS